MLKCFLLLLLAASAALAQPPPGGYVPKRVQQLARVAEPPGGLVPYRKGRLWGYADTTGRVIIAPVFARQPEFFIRGLGQFSYEEEMKADAKSERRYRGWPSTYLFLNARGEVLRADKDHAVVVLADSSLGLIARRANLLAPALFRMERQSRMGRAFRTALRTDGQVQFVTPPVGNVVGEMMALGEGRLMGYAPQHLPAKARWLAPELLRTALLNAQGQRLTPYSYTRIHAFHQGYARCERADKYASRWGLLDRSGREVIPPIYAALSEVANNRILVTWNGTAAAPAAVQTGLLDTTGRFVRPLHAGVAHWVVPGQVLAEESPGRNQPSRLLDASGQPLLGGRLLTSVQPARQGSILAECEPGKFGRLDAQLHWVIPCGQYHFVQRTPLLPGGDSAYQEVRAGRLYGILDVRDGHALVPIRYDTILTLGYPYVYVARRAGRTFVLNSQGREMAEGTLEPDWSPFETQHPTPPVLPVLRPTGELALFDGNGQQLTAWWPYARHHLPKPTSQGRSIVFDEKTRQWGLIDAVGRVLLPFSYSHLNYHWDSFYAAGSTSARGPAYQLYDNDLRLLRSALVSEQEPDQLLFDVQGRAVAAPPGEKWQSPPPMTGGYHPYPFEYGVWYTAAGGYATRGGIRLWED